MGSTSRIRRSRFSHLETCRSFQFWVWVLLQAEGFDVEKVCDEIDPDKVWKTPGQAYCVVQLQPSQLRKRRYLQATGGATVSSAEAGEMSCCLRFPARLLQAMRAARLAKLGGPGAGPGPGPAPTGGYAEGA